MCSAELVLGIGMHETATMSLWAYLNALGYHAVHWPEWYEQDMGKHLHEDNTRIMAILAPLFQEYEAFCDMPFPGLYQELDRRFSNARFLLTVRGPDRWWRSVVWLWKLDQGRTHHLSLGKPSNTAPMTPPIRPISACKTARCKWPSSGSTMRRCRRIFRIARKSCWWSISKTRTRTARSARFLASRSGHFRTQPKGSGLTARVLGPVIPQLATSEIGVTVPARSVRLLRSTIGS